MIARNTITDMSGTALAPIVGLLVMLSGCGQHYDAWFYQKSHTMVMNASAALARKRSGYFDRYCLEAILGKPEQDLSPSEFADTVGEVDRPSFLLMLEGIEDAIERYHRSNTGKATASNAKHGQFLSPAYRVWLYHWDRPVDTWYPIVGKPLARHRYGYCSYMYILYKSQVIYWYNIKRSG